MAAALGDLLFRDSAVWKRLAGNTTATRKFLAQTGTGAVSAAPVLIQPDLADLTGLGTGVSTFLATPTSANLRGALTDETGGGAAVFATGPTLSAPVMTSLVSGSGTVTFPGYTGQVPIVVKSSGTSASTSSLTEFNLAVANIPALGANDMLEIRALFTFTGTAGAKTPVIRHNTSSAATTGGTNLAIVATAANILSARYLYQIQNANSVSVQVANFGVGYGTSTTTNTAGSINTGSASFINFNGLVANGGDACILVSYSVTIIPGV